MHGDSSRLAPGFGHVLEEQEAEAVCLQFRFPGGDELFGLLSSPGSVPATVLEHGLRYVAAVPGLRQIDDAVEIQGIQHGPLILVTTVRQNLLDKVAGVLVICKSHNICKQSSGNPVLVSLLTMLHDRLHDVVCKGVAAQLRYFRHQLIHEAAYLGVGAAEFQKTAQGAAAHPVFCHHYGRALDRLHNEAGATYGELRDSLLDHIVPMWMLDGLEL